MSSRGCYFVKAVSRPDGCSQKVDSGLSLEFQRLVGLGIDRSILPDNNVVLDARDDPNLALDRDSGCMGFLDHRPSPRATFSAKGYLEPSYMTAV